MTIDIDIDIRRHTVYTDILSYSQTNGCFLQECSVILSTPTSESTGQNDYGMLTLVAQASTSLMDGCPA